MTEEQQSGLLLSYETWDALCGNQGRITSQAPGEIEVLTDRLLLTSG